jgi:hypothetical protein
LEQQKVLRQGPARQNKKKFSSYQDLNFYSSHSAGWHFLSTLLNWGKIAPYFYCLPGPGCKLSCKNGGYLQNSVWPGEAPLIKITCPFTYITAIKMGANWQKVLLGRVALPGKLKRCACPNREIKENCVMKRFGNLEIKINLVASAELEKLGCHVWQIRFFWFRHPGS